MQVRPARCLLSFVVCALGGALSAQTVPNSRFDDGLAGWTVTATTANSVGAPGEAELYDMDGPGPRAASPAATFYTGKLPGTTGVGYHGVILARTVELRAGADYVFRASWATSNAAPGTANGGRYRLIILGEVNETVLVGGVPGGGALHGVIEKAFTADTSGPVEIQILIDTPAVVGDPPFIAQRVDDVRLEHGLNSFPGFLSVVGGGIETLELDAGPEFAGHTYWILGSVGGEVPGLDFPGDVHLPLVPDVYTSLTITQTNTPVFSSFLGVLDEDGRAGATLQLPAGVATSLVGLELHHAWLGASGAGAITFGSNGDSILLF